ncbi:MAG: VWA-like domain-containing protein [Desulfococcaceae bacterium]
MAVLSARDRIGRAVERWFLSEPLFFSVWISHDLIADENIRTIRVRRGRIEYNPLFIQSLNAEQLDAVLRFEAMRIVLKHPYNRRKENAQLSYLASNVTIQEYLRTDLPFPSAADLFGSNEFDRQYFEFYYCKLQTENESIFSGSGTAGQSKIPGEDGQSASGGDETEESTEQEGDQESSDEKEDQESGEKESGEKKQPSPEEIYADARESGLENTLDWDRDELFSEKINEKIQMARETDQWGTIPGDVRERILATLRPKLDYRAILRHFRASILSEKRVLTRMKPSRRYGFLNMGSRRDFSTRLLFAVDVSGSVSTEDLVMGFSVINRFFRYGIEAVDVICFDTEIKGKTLSLKKARREISITGRGGTDFGPVMAYIDEHREYDGLIVFTDGCAPVPRIPENRKTRVLWLFNTESNWNQMHKELLSIGRSVFLKEEG